MITALVCFHYCDLKDSVRAYVSKFAWPVSLRPASLTSLHALSGNKIVAILYDFFVLQGTNVVISGIYYLLTQPVEQRIFLFMKNKQSIIQ